MVNDLGESQLLSLFRLFSPNMDVGVKIIRKEDVNGYGIWLRHKSPTQKVEIYEYMASTDATWELLQDEYRNWTVYRKGVKFELEVKNSQFGFSFQTKDWYKLLDKLFDYFKHEFFKELSDDANLYTS